MAVPRANVIFSSPVLKPYEAWGIKCPCSRTLGETQRLDSRSKGEEAFAADPSGNGNYSKIMFLANTFKNVMTCDFIRETWHLMTLLKLWFWCVRWEV